jgi:hypothetical protein
MGQDKGRAEWIRFHGRKAFGLPSQPGTVLSPGILAGTTLYGLAGDPIWAGITGASIKILVPNKINKAMHIRFLAQPNVQFCLGEPR